MAVSVSFINMKGGVGKTTLAMHIALAAAQDGKRVLAIDLDPQANLSQALMGDSYRDHLKGEKPTIDNLFDGYRPSTSTTKSPTRISVDDVILKPIVAKRYWNDPDDLDLKIGLIPSRLELSQILRKPSSKAHRLAEAVAKVADRYDLIVIDCAPTDSILTDAAYFASRYIIVPIRPEFMATIGLPLLGRSLEAFKATHKDRKIDIAGIVFNDAAYNRSKESKRAIEEVMAFAKEEKWPVLANRLPYSASFPTSARSTASLSGTRRVRKTTIDAFRLLKLEVFQKIGLETREMFHTKLMGRL